MLVPTFLGYILIIEGFIFQILSLSFLVRRQMLDCKSLSAEEVASLLSVPLTPKGGQSAHCIHVGGSGEGYSAQ